MNDLTLTFANLFKPESDFVWLVRHGQFRVAVSAWLVQRAQFGIAGLVWPA